MIGLKKEKNDKTYWLNATQALEFGVVDIIRPQNSQQAALLNADKPRK